MNKEVEELIETLKEYGDGFTSVLAPTEESVKALLDYINQLETNNNTAINFIDQVLQYHLCPFDYKQVDEDINTLIGILRSGSNE